MKAGQKYKKRNAYGDWAKFRKIDRFFAFVVIDFEIANYAAEDLWATYDDTTGVYVLGVVL